MPRARNRPKPKPVPNPPEEKILDEDLEKLEVEKDETKPEPVRETPKTAPPAAKQVLSSQLGKGNYFGKGKKK